MIELLLVIVIVSGVMVLLWMGLVAFRELPLRHGHGVEPPAEAVTTGGCGPQCQCGPPGAPEEDTPAERG